MSNEIKIVIKTDGTFTVEVNGVEGSSCETITEALIRNSGEVEQVEYKDEYVQEIPDYIESFEVDE